MMNMDEVPTSESVVPSEGFGIESAQVVRTPIERAASQAAYEPTEPIQLSEDERADFTRVLEATFQSALSARAKVDKNLGAMRSLINLQSPREAPFDGAPNVVTPLIAERVSSIASEAWKAINKEPLFVASPQSAAANRAAPVWEAFMKANLDKTKSIREVKKAVFEACKMPAVALDIEVIRTITREEQPETDYEVRAVAVPIERFYVFPTGTSDMRLLSTFRRDPKPLWYIRDIAEAGYYDADAVERLRAMPDDSPGQEQVGLSDTAIDEDVGQVTVWRSWFRYKGTLWYVVFSGESTVEQLLRAEPDFIGLGQPPQAIVSSGSELQSIMSLSPGEMVRAYQDIQDATFNALLLEAEFATAPPTMVRDRALYKEIQEKGWTPGGFYLSRMPLTDDYLRHYQIPINRASVELLGLTGSLAEKAVPSSPHLPRGGRKSAYEASVWASAGVSRLSVLISNIRDGLEDFAETYWQVLRHFRIDGIAEVYPNSPDDVNRESVYYIATKDIKLKLEDFDGLEDRVQEGARILMQMGLPPQMAQVVAQQVVEPETIEYHIPGAWRSDIVWQLNGTATEVERATQQQSFMLILQTVQLIPAARKDRGIWEMLRGLYQASGITSWRNILGDPPDYVDNDLLMQMMPVLQQIQRQLAGAAGVPVQQGGGSDNGQ